jgi:hypothetical protein
MRSMASIGQRREARALTDFKWAGRRVPLRVRDLAVSHPKQSDRVCSIAAGARRWLTTRAGGPAGLAERVMQMNNPVLALPLSTVMRMEIALPLQQMMQIYTVGCFLRAWRAPRGQKQIECLFDTPEQARQAAATCAAWLGMTTMAARDVVPAWWKGDAGELTGAGRGTVTR